jgi:Ca2+-binding RTX toxin-like protein
MTTPSTVAMEATSLSTPETFSSYAISKNPGGIWLIEDLRVGASDGNDEFVNVETLRFADGDVALASLGMIGSNGAEVMQGTGADDIIDGRGGSDDLFGLGGNDTIAGSAGRDYVDGGAGTDIAVFTGNFADYAITQNANGSWFVEDMRSGSPDETAYLVNMETLRFADGDVALSSLVGVGSTIVGNDSANVINGTDVADTIDGRGGSDDIYAKDGDDTITGGAGRDYIDGGAGTDIAVFTGDFADYAITQNANGSWFVEDMRGGSPDETAYLANMETLRFADGDVALSSLGGGGSGIVGNDSANVIHGTDGADTIDGRGGSDDIYAKAGNDTITGGPGRDYIDGGADTDIAVFTGDFADYAITQNANGSWFVEDMRGGSPDETAYLVNMETLRFVDGDVALSSLGGGGSTIVGNDSANVIHGTDGAETIDGRGGSDDIYANGGDDTITGGAGRDYIDGGAGTDVAVFTGDFADYSIINNANGSRFVEDLRSGSPDETAYLVNIERLQFADTLFDLV